MLSYVLHRCDSLVIHRCCFKVYFPPEGKDFEESDSRYARLGTKPFSNESTALRLDVRVYGSTRHVQLKFLPIR